MALATDSAHGQVRTVLGPVSAADLGFILPHEHLAIDNAIHHQAAPGVDPAAEVSLDLLGMLRVRPHALRSNMVLDDDSAVLADLEAFRRAGGGTIVELTPRGMGRDPVRLAELSRRSGLHVVSGSGYYVHRAHGSDVAGRTVEAIAADLIADLTAPPPASGVIGEIGISAQPHEDEWLVLDAALMAQARTGAAIWIHQTTTAPMAAIIERLARAQADPARIVLCHVDYDLRDLTSHRAALELGLTLELDLFGFPVWNRRNFLQAPDDRMRIERVLELADAGFASQLLVSQDVCMKTQLRRYGGFGYAHLLDNVKELFETLGGSDALWDLLTHHNPAALLAWSQPREVVSPRPAGPR